MTFEKQLRAFGATSINFNFRSWSSRKSWESHGMQVRQVYLSNDEIFFKFGIAGIGMLLPVHTVSFWTDTSRVLFLQQEVCLQPHSLTICSNAVYAMLWLQRCVCHAVSVMLWMQCCVCHLRSRLIQLIYFAVPCLCIKCVPTRVIHCALVAHLHSFGPPRCRTAH